MTDSAPQQSRRERLLARLRELGVDPKRSLGQNFLVSDLVVERILASAKLFPFSEIVEVGPGLGALTEDLVSLSKDTQAPLTLLELDRNFAQIWHERGEKSGLPSRVVEGDALQLDWSTLGLKENALFVSNLPYQISSSLVIERSLEPAGITRMILMFQKEVAQRIAARAKSPDYGLLTVIAQTFWETSTVCEAGPRDFFPPPNVASRVLSFRWRKDNELLASGATAQGFLTFVKAAFSHRRKLLSRNLLGQYFGAFGFKDVELKDVDELFASKGLIATARAEELEPKTFVALYLSARERGWTRDR